MKAAKGDNVGIAMENLEGIRKRSKRNNKTMRTWLNSWAFYQLREQVNYKATIAGVRVEFVNPAYSSQVCSNCLHIHPEKGKSYRNGKRFDCGHCGASLDADVNGARNIASLGAVINQPKNSKLRCSLTAFEGQG
ncbi:MAG: zinc ribbon domain-containing protein [Prochloraceae cyanobacterium]|nr:zinc ribbon domain-containing protein [Prochloraceae cyanobacterium]